MMPFQNKREASSSAPADRMPRQADGQDQDDYGLQVAMQDLMDALTRQDAKAACEAFKAAFQLCDLQPHEEGPHLGE